ncbi:MAG: FkbM family methyltransferase [Bacteroidota bacterium]
MNYLIRLKFVFYSLYSYLFKTAEIKITDKIKFSIETKNMHEVHRAKTFFTKEPEMLDWIRHFEELNGDDKFIFYDIGANIGIYSLFAATIHQNSIVYSFEPEATNFSSLCCNISNNNLKNIIPVQIALSNTVEFDLLHVGIVKSGAGAAAVGKEYAGIVHSQSFLQGVYCNTLNNLYNDRFFKKPNFIKIDVDGHESKILQAADKIFSDPILKGVIIEYEYSSDNEMEIFISNICSHGFKLVLKSKWVDYNEEKKSSVRNFLFERGK